MFKYLQIQLADARLFFLVGSLFFSNACYALLLSGIVMDEAKNAVENAIIHSSSQVKFTNEHGKFVIRVLEKDTLKIVKYGYEKKRINIKTEDRNLRVYLKQKTIELDGVDVVAKARKKSLLSKKIDLKEQNIDASIGEVVMQNASAHGTQSALVGEEKHVSLLGHKSKHTLVILDGVPMNKNGESFDLNSIPASLIESVEIIEGNASSIGGSGAIGGVILLKTKNKKTTETQHISSSTKFGSFESFQTSQTYFIQDISFQSRTTYNFEFAQNDFPFSYVFQNSPQTQRRENNSKKIEKINESLKFYTRYGIFSTDIFFKDAYKELPGPTTHMTKYKSANLKADYLQRSLSYMHNMSFFVPTVFQLTLFDSDDTSLYDNTESTLLSAKYASQTVYDKTYIAAEVEQDFSFFIFQLKGDFKREKYGYKQYDSEFLLVDNATLSATQFNSSYAFNYRPKKVSFLQYFPSFSLRYDYFKTDIEDQNSEKNISWRVEEKLPFLDDKVHLSLYFANAFQIPSFYELYWKGDSQASGNPDLKPEESSSYGIRFDAYYGQHIQFKTTWNYDKIDNMIHWIRSVSSNWKPINMARAQISNFSSSIYFDEFYFFNASVEWTRTFAFNKSKIETLHNQLLTYTPSSITICSIGADFSNFVMGAEWKRIGHQNTKMDSNSKQLAPQEYLNIRLDLKEKINFFEINTYFNIDNVLDSRYEIYSASPNPGRIWSVGLALKINL